VGYDRIFVNQEKFIGEVFKKFRIEDYAKLNTLVKYGVKMSKNNERGAINSITFKNLVGSLNILFGVGLVKGL
jgi:hypothetical protein